MSGITGKVGIVTGASTLIGQAVAQALVGAGASVVMADIADEAGMAAAEQFGEKALLAHRCY
ncbi:MAG: SDR family NAD(P)-dependent oxidoreductase [Novosphingobium sp.]